MLLAGAGDPVSWQAPSPPGYTGVHAPNDRLADLETIPLGDEEGPEHIVLAGDGKLYAAVASGGFLRMAPNGAGQEVFVNTGGRVLGFDFDAAGNLIAADAIKGLLSISPEGKITVLADQVGGAPIRYADAVVVAADGAIYFSDASTRFAPAAWGGTFEASILDIIEQSCTGRILAYDPATKKTRIVAKGLSFANGVALSRDEQFLFVNETGKYRVWKIAVSADNLDLRQKSPLATVLLDNLPGYPDNLMRGLDGKIWLGYAKPRNPTVDNWRTNPSCANSSCACRAPCGPCPGPTAMWMRSPKTDGSWPTSKTPQVPTPKPRPSPKPRIGYTYKACTPKPSDGCRGERAGRSRNGDILPRKAKLGKTPRGFSTSIANAFFPMTARLSSIPDPIILGKPASNKGLSPYNSEKTRPPPRPDQSRTWLGHNR